MADINEERREGKGKGKGGGIFAGEAYDGIRKRGRDSTEDGVGKKKTGCGGITDGKGRSLTGAFLSEGE